MSEFLFIFDGFEGKVIHFNWFEGRVMDAVGYWMIADGDDGGLGTLV